MGGVHFITKTKRIGVDKRILIIINDCNSKDIPTFLLDRQIVYSCLC